jgi:hypothetical protein
MRNTYKILVKKPEWERLPQRPCHRQEDNIGMDFKKVGGKAWNGCLWLRIGKGGRFL